MGDARRIDGAGTEPEPAHLDGVPGYLVAAWHGDAGRRPGPRRSLDLRTIAVAGVALADDGGVACVSMRSVAAKLGMSSMGLYRYVQSKHELLALMIDQALGPPDIPAYGTAAWRDRLTTWSYAARARYEAHPWVLNVSLPDPPALPNQSQWTERGLEALTPTGLTETEKLSALLLVNVYVRGQTQLAAGLAQARPSESPVDEYARLLLRLVEPERFPCLVAAMTQRSMSPPGDFAEDEFRFGLNTILDGISCR